MNKPTRYLILILAALLCVGCISCTGKEENPAMESDTVTQAAGTAAATTAGTPTEPETDMPTESPTESPTEAATDADEPVITVKTVTLQTADSVMALEADDDKLTVTSLKTAGGTELLPAPSGYALPESIRNGTKDVDVFWKLTAVTTGEGTENGTAYTSGVFTYQSTEFPVTLTVTVLARPSLAGPFEFRSVMENTDTADLRILPGTFASLTVGTGGELVSVKKESGMAEGYKHSDGQYFAGTGIYRTPADEKADVNAWVNTLQNFNSSGFLPMVFLDRGDSGAYCALEWSSGRVLAKGSDAGITFSVDMDKVAERPKTFITTLRGNDRFILPSVYIGAYDGTLDTGSNLFKHWFFSCKAPAALRDNPMEPLTQMDMQTGFNTYGIESIKWDYGWWSNDALGGWKSLEGSWQLRSSAYVGVINGYGGTTLADFGLEAQKRGINWTVYLLLHDTLDAKGQATDEFGEFNSKTHPDWFSNRKIADGMGYSADLGNEACVAYLKTALVDFFGQNHIGTWRTDFEPICYSSNKANRHDKNGTDVMYWCTYGFREIIDELYDKVDGFRYESCSSGGSMKDLFTATLAVSINTDDAANYMSMRTTFYDSSYVIHPAQLQMPCNVDCFNPDKGKSAGTFWPKVVTSAGDDFDFNKAMLDMGFRSMCLGSPMFSSWTATVLSDYYTTYAEMYANKIRPLVRDGDLYHILPRPDGTHYDGVMYADADSQNEIKGLVFLFKPSEQAGDTCHLTLQGLDPDTTYRLSFEDRPEQSCSATGAALMGEGLDVSIRYVGSELIWITEEK